MRYRRTRSNEAIDSVLLMLTLETRYQASKTAEAVVSNANIHTVAIARHETRALCVLIFSHAYTQSR